MCKALNIPLDHPLFLRLSPIQWRWYLENIVQDKKELFGHVRDAVEYLAAFWNKEAVDDIRKRREAKKLGLDDEQFEEYVREQFGTTLDSDKMEKISLDEMNELFKKDAEGREEIISDELDDLDTVRVIPMEQPKKK